MTIINRYLALQVLVGLVVATAVILPAFSFLDLLEQLGKVGTGTYRVQDALLDTTFLLPRRFIQLAPFIALLGTVFALGRLAVNLELTALRVAGLSPTRISLAPLGVGLALLLFIAVLEQFVAPYLQQKAFSNQAAAFGKTAELGKGLGIWTRDEQNILRIGEMQGDKRAESIELMHFDRNGFLVTYTHAKYAIVIDDNLWELNDVITKTFTGERVESANASSILWKSFVNSEDISTLNKSPESLSPTELFQHVSFLRNTGQEADSYSMALWRKMGGALTTIAMLLFSIPFVLGSARTGLGRKMVLAALMGVGIYLVDQIIANTGLRLNFNPLLTALIPGLALITLASLWLRRFF